MTEGNIITTDGYLLATRSIPGVIYSKRDFLLRNGVWRGVKQKALLLQPWHVRKQVVVMSHSDHLTRPLHSRTLRLLGVTRVFATNLIPYRDFASPLPLGLCEPSKESHLHRVFGDPSHLLAADRAADPPERFRGRLYANFSVRNNPRVRQEALNVVATLPRPWSVTVDHPDPTPLGRVQYLRKCREFDLILCPEGNGIDTHRLWETLYMGGTPVVLRNPAINELTKHLPVLSLESWQELRDIENIAQRWSAIQNQNWSHERLEMSFWRHRIEQATAASK